MELSRGQAYRLGVHHPHLPLPDSGNPVKRGTGRVFREPGGRSGKAKKSTNLSCGWMVDHEPAVPARKRRRRKLTRLTKQEQAVRVKKEVRGMRRFRWRFRSTNKFSSKNWQGTFSVKPGVDPQRFINARCERKNLPAHIYIEIAPA